MTIRFGRHAQARFIDALGFSQGRSPATAERFRRITEAVLNRLVTFPDSGPIVEEFPDRLYREVLAAPYRFFDRNDGETIIIVAV